jgi:RHS repeat-associated protein
MTVYRHDAQGNLSVEADFATATDTSDLTKAWRVIDRKWNKRSELERARIITRLDGTDTTQLRYEYGEDGNRVASLVATGITGTDTAWQVTHRWVYDGTSIVADSGAGHGWTWHGFQGLNRVAEITDTASNKPRVRYVLVDHQGSTQKLLDDTGAVLGQWVWDPWGNLEYARTDASTDLLYQGKTLEPKLGDWYFNARWYNAERGSFTGRDPKEQFYSPYNYVGNGPINRADPSGLYDWSAYWNNVGHNFLGAADAASLEIGPAVRKSIFPDLETNIDYSNAAYKIGHLEGIAFSAFWGGGVRSSNGIGSNIPVKNVIPESIHDGVLRTSKIGAAKMEHIFSADHLKKGIMELGKSKDAILNQTSEILVNANKPGGLRDGMNTIFARMNGQEATVRAYIKNGEMISLNIFKGISERLGQYVIDLR